MRRRGGRRIRVLLAVSAAVVVVLALAQLFGPSIAASTVSERVGRYGHVQSVRVSAWPAIRLLWGSADSVRLSASSLALTPARSAALLAEADGTASVDATVAALREGPLRLTDVRLRKRGPSMVGEGLIRTGAIAAALPPGVHIELVASAGGQVHVRVGGGPFGNGSIAAVARSEHGTLLAEVLGGGLAGARMTLFQDPRIDVVGVAAALASTHPLSYRVRMSARLR